MKRFSFFLLTLVGVLFSIGYADQSVLLGVTTLGLFGSGDFETNELPHDWRETILYLFPNGDAPLTAMLSKMRREKTSSTKFHWWEKGLVKKATAINNGAGYTNVATDLTVDDASMFRKDAVVFVPRTQEIMVVTSDPASATVVNVSRGAAGTTNLALLDNDELLVVGTAFAEGTKSGNPIYTGPGEVYNYAQIFKTPLEITATAHEETTRTGSKYQDMKEEALRSHSIDMELGFLFGNRHVTTGSNGKPLRFTGGIDRHFITSNRFDAAGTLTPTKWNNYMEQLSQKGSMERLLLCGSRFTRVIHEMIKNDTQYQITSGETVYGVRFHRLVTPFGMDLLLKIHPLFNTTAYLQKYGIVLDLNNITERFFRDTDFKTDVHDNDADEKKDCFLTETGLEVQHEETHAVFENFNAFSAT